MTKFNIPAPDDPQFNQKMSDVMDSWAGNRNPLDELLTKNDIGSLVPGAVATAVSSTTGKSSRQNYPGNPGAPRNVSVITTGINSHLISWRNPVDKDLYYIELWCAAVAAGDSAPVFANASRISVITEIGKYDQWDSITRADINSTYDYYYWMIAYDYAGNPSSVAFAGSALFEDSPTIDNLIDQLKGGDPATFDPDTYYTYKQQVSYNDGDATKRYVRTAYLSGTVNGTTDGVYPEGLPSDLYWERIGILTVGTIDGVSTVGIDGYLIVNKTIMAPAIRGDAFGTLTISSGEIIIQSANGLQIGSGGDLSIASGGNISMASGGTMSLVAAGGDGITINGSGLSIVGAVTFSNGSSGYGNISDAPTDSTNFVTDGDMEKSGTDFWAAWGGAISKSTSEHYAGSQSLAVTHNASGGANSYAFDYLDSADHYMKVTVGDVLSAGGWCKALAAGVCRINIRIRDASGADTGEYLNLENVSSASWEALQGTLTITSTDAAYAEFYVRCAPSGTGGTSYFDSVSMYRGGTPFAYDSDKTYIDGGKIYAGSLLEIGDPSGNHVIVQYNSSRSQYEMDFMNDTDIMAWIDAVAFRSTIQPSVSMKMARDGSAVTGKTGDTGYAIVWDTEEEDQGSNMVSNTYFTAPCDCRINIEYSVILGGWQSDNYGKIYIYTSTAETIGSYAVAVTNVSGVAMASSSKTISLAEGDSVELVALILGHASDTVYIKAGSWMSIHMVG